MDETKKMPDDGTITVEDFMRSLCGGSGGAEKARDCKAPQISDDELREIRREISREKNLAILEHWNEVIERREDDWHAYLWRGIGYVYLKDYNKALSDFNSAIDLMDDDFNREEFFYCAYVWRARAYFFMGEYEKALQDNEKALRLNPADLGAALGLKAARRKLEKAQKTQETGGVAGGDPPQRG